MIIFAFSLLADVFLVGVLVSARWSGQIDYPALPLLARFGFNLAALGSLTACMIAYRGEFTARRQPGSVAQGPAHPDRSVWSSPSGWRCCWSPSSPTNWSVRAGRLVWIAKRLEEAVFGADASLVPRPVSAPPSWINTVVGLLFGLTLLAAIVALVRSQRRASIMSAEDEPRVRALVAESAGGLAGLLRHPPRQVGGLRRQRSLGHHLPGRSRGLPGQQRPDRAGRTTGRPRSRPGRNWSTPTAGPRR